MRKVVKKETDSSAREAVALFSCQVRVVGQQSKQRCSSSQPPPAGLWEDTEAFLSSVFRVCPVASFQLDLSKPPRLRVIQEASEPAQPASLDAEEQKFHTELLLND